VFDILAPDLDLGQTRPVGDGNLGITLCDRDEISASVLAHRQIPHPAGHLKVVVIEIADFGFEDYGVHGCEQGVASF